MNALVTVPAASYPVSDLERMARAFAASKLFGVQNAEQALALCLVAQAEGRHPASAAQDYNIIQGRPAKKADAMLRDFIASGGKVEWHTLDDTLADATFAHPAGGTVRIAWDHKRAQAAGINNPMWKKYPRQMLRSRTVSEGVRTVCPGATSGMYVPEEVQDFEPARGVAMLPAPEPEAVTLDGNALAGAAKAAIDICETLAEADAWRVNNSEFMENLGRDDSDAHDDIVRHWKAHVKAIKARTPAPAKAAFPGDFGRVTDEDAAALQ